ncbi:hypothetical protein GOODEAATRI_022972 [Goodea atripinnis]|uniref:Uncharacterized protein n=1 Tax=Goodea atripinnis TaxID=208336 RepID=A0ABV0NQW1_9TELE
MTAVQNTRSTQTVLAASLVGRSSPEGKVFYLVSSWAKSVTGLWFRIAFLSTEEDFILSGCRDHLIPLLDLQLILSDHVSLKLF